MYVTADDPGCKFFVAFFHRGDHLVSRGQSQQEGIEIPRSWFIVLPHQQVANTAGSIPGRIRVARYTITFEKKVIPTSDRGETTEDYNKRVEEHGRNVDRFLRFTKALGRTAWP